MIIFRLLLIYLYTVQVLFSASALSVEYASLAHEEKDPDGYTLLCLDTTMIPKAAQISELKTRTVIAL